MIKTVTVNGRKYLLQIRHMPSGERGRPFYIGFASDFCSNYYCHISSVVRAFKNYIHKQHTCSTCKNQHPQDNGREDQCWPCVDKKYYERKSK